MDPSTSIFEQPIERALLVGVLTGKVKEWAVQESIRELEQLTESAGGRVADRWMVKQGQLNAATYIGSGKIEQMAEHAKAQDIQTILFDDELSPVQGRNIERITQCRIMDRTQVILDIFSRHARTREGRLQTALAQMEYNLPRLRHMWTHLERQRGGIGVRGGPGEQQMEIDRRRIQESMLRIRRELNQVRKRRKEQRKGRQRHGWALLSLVGYTNAGKSTLLNALTDSNIPAYDQLFATLDPTTRQVTLPNQQLALVTDTVGFISKLPHGLVDSFKATLEEVVEAELLLHVIDASHPEVDHQIDAVRVVLEELGVGDCPVLHVLNKMDLPRAKTAGRRLERILPDAVCVSAFTGEGLDDLLSAVADQLKDRNMEVHLRIPLKEGRLLAQLQSAANILKASYEGEYALIHARVPVHLYGDCRPYERTSEHAPEHV